MGNNAESPARDMFFDTCKYLLIILVITGHELEGYKHLHGWMEYLYSFIYLFHMPFFAFISGYFSKRLTINKLTKGSLLLIESFIILQVGFLWLRNHEIPDMESIFSPWYAPWYLLSLFWWRLAAFLCLKVKRPVCCLSIAVVTGLFSGFLYGNVAPTSFLSMVRTLVFLPFFIAGLYTLPAYLRIIRQLNHLPFIMIVLLVGCSLLFFNVNDLNIIEYGNGFHWNEFPVSESVLLFGKRLYFFGSAGLLVVSFLNLTPVLKKCAGFGSKTMFFFSYHIFLLIFLNYYVRRWFHIIHPGWWYPLFCVVVTVVVLNVCSGFRLFYYLLNPISSLVEVIRGKRDK